MPPIWRSADRRPLSILAASRLRLAAPPAVERPTRLAGGSALEERRGSDRRQRECKRGSGETGERRYERGDEGDRERNAKPGRPRAASPERQPRSSDEQRDPGPQ